MIKTLEPYWLGIPVRSLDEASPTHAARVLEIAERAAKSPGLVPISFPLELFRFLRGCRYLPAADLFEHVLLPMEFERRRAGTALDHALWAWRKCIDLGEDARLTVGTYHQEPHAWVTIYGETEPFVLETTHKGELELLQAWDQWLYEPSFSINANLHYFEHIR